MFYQNTYVLILRNILNKNSALKELKAKDGWCGGEEVLMTDDLRVINKAKIEFWI